MSPPDDLAEQIVRPDTQPGLVAKESAPPRLGPPVVTGAPVLLEAWPGTDGIEEFVPSIPAFLRPTPPETGDVKPPR